jgi:endo-alpha-1,4-polygalactosaminidase (GH114 family)
VALSRRPLPALVLALAACGDGEGDAASTTASSPTTVDASPGTAVDPTDAADPTGTDPDPSAPDTTAPDPSAPDTTAPDPSATDTTATSDDPTATDPTATTGAPPDEDPDPDAPPVQGGPWWHPGVATSWQIQLTGDLVTDVDADLYDIDLFDAPQATIDALRADGRKVVCYFSAGSGEDWRPDHDQFDPAALGQPLDGWPGEVWLDVRHPSVWQVMRGRLDLAVDKHCDGVDPDNMDGWLQDSGFPLTAADQRAYNRWIANQAHLRGLTVGLKNAGDQVPELVDYFDFELNEQCHEYDECEQLAPFTAAGKPVFNIEYPGDEADAEAAAASICPAAQAADLRTLLLPYELDGSWRVACD